MSMQRRSFLSGSAAAGLLIQPAAAALASPAIAQPEALPFGPDAGLAQLSRNENPYGPAPTALKAIATTSEKGCYYADKGVERLRAMIAERHGLSPKQVVIGSGSTEILCAVALAWGRKGKILCPGLFWDTTLLYGERQGTQSLRVPLTGKMEIDLPAMQSALSDDISLVHLCNPNNPTGLLLDPATLRSFATSVTPKATLLIDEAYNELVDDPAANSMVDLVRAGQDIIVCRTFSKIYGMAGMRVGYALTSEANAAEIESYLMSFGGNVSGLAAAIASYNDTAFLDRSKAMVAEGRGLILEAVDKCGLTALPTQANFVFVEVPDANAVRDAMAKRNITIRGAYGKWKQYSRVSAGRLDDVRRYAAALPEVIGEVAAA